MSTNVIINYYKHLMSHQSKLNISSFLFIIDSKAIYFPKSIIEKKENKKIFQLMTYITLSLKYTQFSLFFGLLPFPQIYTILLFLRSTPFPSAPSPLLSQLKVLISSLDMSNVHTIVRFSLVSSRS